MKITIIPEDGFVAVDGDGYSKLDLSFMDTNIHALQWYGSDGEIERKDERGRIVSNEEVTDITPYQTALDSWQAAKEIAEQEAIAIIESLETSVATLESN
jgi:hypothetical protein